MEIRDARSLAPIAQEELRLRAIKAVMDGKKQVEVARILGVTRQTVGKWVRKFREGNEKALKAKRRGRRKGGSLLPWQAAQIAKSITDHLPDQLKLPFYLWTREAAAQLIEQRFGIRLSIWTVGRYLNRWGFTPQKPVRRAYEQSLEAVQQWLQKGYPAIQKQARKEKGLIYWGDEMGLRSDHAVGRSWGRCGQTPVIPGTGQRFVCNMVSAINKSWSPLFHGVQIALSLWRLSGLSQSMVRQIQRKVFLIVYGHPVHHAVKVKHWIEKHPNQIRLFFLPGYRPELNPD